ncbi:M12 family metallopeptidase [Aquimarina gracilis]|uniref:M12 family metallopeptidase n=1 Tax=Aquimarina gracilis TaxID=874422 RepID=A0ABU5ZY50_9FLAO|nr:M12 family metallopeptidase [Aquimarina gracilis]MEB3346798.1 M12 family metallopeptidase [Aquimarina gracilis]
MKTKNLINLVKVTALGLGLFITSCSNENFEELPPETSETPELIEKYFRGGLVEVEDLKNGMFKWGDIYFTEEQLQDEKTDFGPVEPGSGIDAKLGLASGVRKWPNNTIIYVLDNSLTSNQRQVTFDSMEEWTSKTNIKFKERTSENYYVTIRNSGRQCNCASASLGVQGTRGTINMGVRTGIGVMTHEIGHTLGYLHEQNRSDRNQYVQIFPENIQDGAISQFRVDNNSVNPGTFDVESIMIYSSFTFSKNGQPVMLELDGSRIPFRSRLSAGDIAGTNQLYPAGDGGGGGGGGTDICAGVEEWVRGRQYNVGDKVTYQGFLYERDFTRWNRIGECETTTPTPADICEGIAAYSRNRSYSPGDQVTYAGYLFELQNNRRWSNLGRCGS